MKVISISNPVYSNADNSQIDCEIETAVGTFPFTAHPNDVEKHGREIFNEIVAGNHGAIGAYVEKKR